MQSACAVLYCHLWPVWLYHIFSTLSHKRHGFRKKVVGHKIWVFSLQLSSETFLILRKIQQHISVHRFSCKVPLFLSDFNERCIFQGDFRKMLKSMKILPVGAELLHGDGQTRHDKANSRFSQFCEKRWYSATWVYSKCTIVRYEMQGTRSADSHDSSCDNSTLNLAYPPILSIPLLHARLKYKPRMWCQNSPSV
jgi:hypothetical protein